MSRRDNDPNRGNRRIPLTSFRAADLLGLNDDEPACPSEPTEGQRQAALEEALEKAICDFRRDPTRIVGGSRSTAAEAKALMPLLAKLVAEAEARGHARGVAEAGAMAERVAAKHPSPGYHCKQWWEPGRQCPTLRALSGEE